MNPYKCRRATASDMMFLQLTCTDTSADYWDQVGKEPVEWTDTFKAEVGRKTNWVALSPTNDRIAVGLLLMSWRLEREVPAVQIAAMASARTLPERERIGVHLSLLIAGYPDCVSHGIKRGYSLMAASNTPAIKTLDLAGRFVVTPYKMMPDALTPAVLLAQVEPIDAGYLESLEKALKEL